jgi:hypothetical protein
MRPANGKVGRAALGRAIQAAIRDPAHELAELMQQDRRFDQNQHRQ